MAVRGLDYVALGVTDMAKAVAFYRDTLGLRITGEDNVWMELDTGNMTLALFDVTAESMHLVAESGWKNAIVALSVTDIATMLAELRTQGVPVVEELSEHPPCYGAMIEDPFGNRLLLHQRKDGTFGYQSE